VYISMLAGATLLVFSRILRMEEAYRAIEWNAIFLIAGMYPASIAIVQTGLAEFIGRQMLLSYSGFGPLGLAGVAYLLSAILTQVMGG
jgi:di/tricarboxylate transporter